MRVSRTRSLLLASLLLLPAGVQLLLNAPNVRAEVIATDSSSSEATAQKVLVVDPAMGSDSGSDVSVLKTISHALSIAESGTTIRLKSGEYSQATGERFPLVVPAGVNLVGNVSSQGQDVKIVGGDIFGSSWWGRQNAAILVKGSSVIKGISVTNPHSRGTGIWVESAAATITDSFFSQNLREGIFVAGKSSPTIRNNKFVQNSANGIAVSNFSTGVIANNYFERTGFGIAVSEDASPMIKGNQIQSNVDGVVISHRATPQMYGNQILNNERDGVVIIADAAPVLGTSSNPGQNLIKGNGRHAINNASKGGLLASSGNDIQETLAQKSPELPKIQGEVNTIVPVSPIAKETPVALPASLDSIESISIDGKKYISIEDMLRLLQ